MLRPDHRAIASPPPERRFALKLYMHPAACSLSPHIVCRELGLPIELVGVDRATHRTSAGEDYLRINGNGYEGVWVYEEGLGTIEDCDLTGNARGPWDVKPDCRVVRRNNRER